jgi:hypothetical protein
MVGVRERAPGLTRSISGQTPIYINRWRHQRVDVSRMGCVRPLYHPHMSVWVIDHSRGVERVFIPLEEGFSGVSWCLLQSVSPGVYKASLERLDPLESGFGLYVVMGIY